MRIIQQGATLIELIVTIVILGVAAIGISTLLTTVISGSADPMIRAQASAIAQSYMEEILAREYTDPDSSNNASETRATYDDLDDYHNPTFVSVTDQNDASVSGLEGYRVKVEVVAATLNSIAGKKITVTVRHQSSPATYPVSAYRFN